MKVLGITQARIGSSRLPQKILLKIADKTLLQYHLERATKASKVTKWIVATTVEPDSGLISEVADGLGIESYKGDIANVLSRFYEAAKHEQPDYIVRITSDCPLVDPQLIDEIVEFTILNQFNYCRTSERFPDGVDVEVFTYKALEDAYLNASLPSDKEHVTPYMRRKPEQTGIFESNHDFENIRFTVDEPADFEAVKLMIEKLGIGLSWLDYTNYIINNISLFTNQQIIRDEGYLKSIKNDKLIMGKGQELYKKAKTLIPGGTMLLSKRPEMFLPDNWPSYYSKSKGCKVWDLDGMEYVDMCIMGIGTNTLGYGNDEVDAAVIQTVGNGNMSTLSCPEEVWLAEELIQMNPWADMVRFARSGGEANAIAIRIARAASGKDKVAICGYHGWHDWYLSINHNQGDGLAGHLLPGMDPLGVPKNLKDTVYPFHYNNIQELEELVKNQDIGVIKMEVVRNFGPEDNFLQKVRDLATKNNIVLVFDECTSGFRETYGGIFKKFRVEPDVAMFGKTIGNGYALTAVVGKRAVMEAAQKTFISSTFWTERIGPTAALKTLEVMKRLKSWEIITERGVKMQKGWSTLANSHGLNISISGIPSLSTYSFNGKDALKYKTLLTQEMLKKGFLASTNFYASVAHEDKYFDSYFNALNEVYKIISDCAKELKNVDQLLEGPVCHSGFKRLN